MYLLERHFVKDALPEKFITLGVNLNGSITITFINFLKIKSIALALTVLDKEKDETHIFDLASGGFSSTVRLAKSNPDMWIPILSQNRENILHVMDTYIDKMQAFRKAIDEGDEEAVRGLIEEANKIRRIIR